MNRIFMSVPDGPYWAKKEERERAEARNRRVRDKALEEEEAKPRVRRKARVK